MILIFTAQKSLTLYKKYPWYEENNQIIIKALTFFEEANKDEEVKRITVFDNNLNWNQVKKEITTEVKQFMATQSS